MAQPRVQAYVRIALPHRQPQARPFLRFFAWFVPFAAGFLAIWIGSYVTVEALDLRFCQPFRQEHMHKVRFFQTEVPAVDVVYLGSSQMHFGVMPPVVSEELKKEGCDLGRQYNLAVPGAELELSWILARDVLKDGQLPKRLIVGVMPVMVAANEDGNPTYLQQYGSLRDVAGRVRDGSVSPTGLVTTSFRGIEVLLQYPVASARRPMVQFRAAHLRESDGGWFKPGDEENCLLMTAEDWERHLGRLKKPKPLYFRDDSRPAVILRSLQAWATRREVDLTLVYSPQHPDLMHRKWGFGTEERYQDWIASFCQREGIHYLDLSEPDKYVADDFLDTMHLNARGAVKFSRRLAETCLLHASPKR